MGKSGTTKYPKMFNLPSPFNMESKRLNKLKKKGDEAMKKKRENIDNKREDKKKLDEMWKATKSDDKSYKFSKKDADRGEQFFHKINNSVPDYMLRNLKDMPNNKGYIWRGMYCFGELPPERNCNTTIMFEKKPRGVLINHEQTPTMYKTYEKQGKNKRVLIHQEYRKIKK